MNRYLCAKVLSCELILDHFTSRSTYVRAMMLVSIYIETYCTLTCKCIDCEWVEPTSWKKTTAVILGSFTFITLVNFNQLSNERDVVAYALFPFIKNASSFVVNNILPIIQKAVSQFMFCYHGCVLYF